MSLLDDDLIDKIDIYLLKSRLIDYLKIHSWYDDFTDSNLLPVQSCYYYATEPGRIATKRVIQYRYKISINEFNQTIKLITSKNFPLVLVLEHDEEIPDFILECIKDCELNIVRGRINLKNN